MVRKRVSTKSDIGVPPHLRDPYETNMVCVTQSSITGSGEGLQVRADVEAGTIVAFYHGLRMSAKEENPFGRSTGYSIFLEWDRDKRDKADVLDLSPEVSKSYKTNIIVFIFSSNQRKTTPPHWLIKSITALIPTASGFMLYIPATGKFLPSKHART